MYISRIKLQNWKNFQNVEARLGPRMFLIGPNASGKSNLLDALRFLRDVATVGLRPAVDDLRGGVSALRCLAARPNTDIGVEVDVTEAAGTVWTYHLLFNQAHQKPPEVRGETVLKDGAQLLGRPTAEDERDPLLRTQTALEQISENQAFRELAEFFKSVTYQHLLPQVVRDPRGFSPLPVQNDPYGRDFLARLWKTAPQTRAARLKKIQRALQGAAPQLSELRAEMDETGIPHLIGVYSHWQPRSAGQNESQFSDGTLRLFGLLWAVFESGGPLLLEEPELSLHPEIVRRLPAIFYRINQMRGAARQIIISTHSNEMLSDPGIAAEEVLILKPNPAGTQVTSPGEADRQAMQAGLTAADTLIPQTAPENIEQILLEFGYDR